MIFLVATKGTQAYEWGWRVSGVDTYLSP